MIYIKGITDLSMFRFSDPLEYKFLNIVYILLILIIIILIYNKQDTLVSGMPIKDTTIIDHFIGTWINPNTEKNYYYILDKHELLEILINDYDDYYTTFNKMDLIVRNVSSIEEYKDKINNDPITISINEKKIIMNTIYKIKDIFNNYQNIGFNGKKANEMNITIGIIDGINYEEGFPHTRGNNVIIPKYLINRKNLITVLIHEIIHIYQKVYPDDIQIYLDTHKFKKNNKRGDNSRANPDIDEYIYSNSNNELLYCIYNNNSKSIMDVTYFPINNDMYEHPFEMMAYNIESDIKNKYNL